MKQFFGKKWNKSKRNIDFHQNLIKVWVSKVWVLSNFDQTLSFKSLSFCQSLIKLWLLKVWVLSKFDETLTFERLSFVKVWWNSDFKSLSFIKLWQNSDFQKCLIKLWQNSDFWNSDFDQNVVNIRWKPKKKLQERHWESWKKTSVISCAQGGFQLFWDGNCSFQAWSHSPHLHPAANKNEKFNNGGGVVLFLNLASYRFFPFPLWCVRLISSYLSFPSHLLQTWHSFDLFSFPFHHLHSLQPLAQGLFPGQFKSKYQKKWKSLEAKT